MEEVINSKLEKKAKEYDDLFAPDNFYAYMDGAEYAIDEACAFLRGITYQEFPGGPLHHLISEDLIDELREKVLKR